jgi:hypothetical protein
MSISANGDNLLRLDQVYDLMKKLSTSISLARRMAAVRHRIVRLMWMERKDIPEEDRFADAREQAPDDVRGTFADCGTFRCLFDR